MASTTRKTTSKTTSNNRNTRSTAKKSGSMANSKFHKLFLDELKDIYWAEKNLVKALPKMQKGATSEELASAIADHVEQTKEHVSRLEQVFEMLEERAVAKKCEAMEGLIEEGKQVLEDTDEDSMVRDAGIIIASQKIEHYEIAAYGSLYTLASKMGHDEVAQLLEQTLAEEKETDSLLTNIAESTVNDEALAE
ncbi:ferritin-like domain-containing protein [Chitinophaga pendula]|uniref:YciE/YciF ferroxidase family protein n=1 Tax=Chitinophaga TaxID=79328 RepID=UPI000BAF7BE6|nr:MULTISPECIES: ferritin-like domain-containing protein [Chitinophaga]ASZ10589.1 rubrerythrin family protein [Chitinophaga sp. MD30]UCJ06435.1 ferritin-like domain-containing protein [Chitinophaga pendula]